MLQMKVIFCRMSKGEADDFQRGLENYLHSEGYIPGQVDISFLAQASDADCLPYIDPEKPEEAKLKMGQPFVRIVSPYNRFLGEIFQALGKTGIDCHYDVILQNAENGNNGKN